MSSSLVFLDDAAVCHAIYYGDRRVVSGPRLDFGQVRVAAERWAPLLKGAPIAEVALIGSEIASTADQTAFVRVVMNLTDCGEGTVSIVSPDLRYISRIFDGMTPKTCSQRNA